MVEEVFSNAIDCLSDEDKKLPQVCVWGRQTAYLHSAPLGVVTAPHRVPTAAGTLSSLWLSAPDTCCPRGASLGAVVVWRLLPLCRRRQL